MSNTDVIVKLLGGKKALGKKVETNDDLISIVRHGLPFVSFQHVVNIVEGEEDLISYLKMSTRTLARRRRQVRLRPDESDRVLRLARIVARAEEVFGEGKKAVRWLQKPNRTLGGISPLSLLDTDIGTEKVIHVLGRIEHGVIA